MIRNFEIIGEAAKNIPAEVTEKYPDVPWKKMIGLRNLIAHHYFGIDYEMIWEIAQKSLRQNAADLQTILRNEQE